MIMKFKPILITILCAILSSCVTKSLPTANAASGQGGWDRVKWGDSRHEVLKQYPEAEHLNTKNGKWPLKAPRVEVGLDFEPEAVFHFHNDKLWSVFLTDVRAQSWRHANAYSKVKVLMNERYGKPYSEDVLIGSYSKGYSLRTVWKNEIQDVHVSMSVTDKPTDSSLFVLAYASNSSNSNL
jgi:hypothetical protein